MKLNRVIRLFYKGFIGGLECWSTRVRRWSPPPPSCHLNSLGWGTILTKKKTTTILVIPRHEWYMKMKSKLSRKTKYLEGVRIIFIYHSCLGIKGLFRDPQKKSTQHLTISITKAGPQTSNTLHTNVYQYTPVLRVSSHSNF